LGQIILTVFNESFFSVMGDILRRGLVGCSVDKNPLHRRPAPLHVPETGRSENGLASSIGTLTVPLHADPPSGTKPVRIDRVADDSIRTTVTGLSGSAA
jgi:hypothetical protein